jgi:glutaconate CoA-transferase subunit A
MKSNPIFVSIADLVQLISDGDKIAIPKDTSGVAMSATKELIKKSPKNLHLVCVPIGGIQADILIGSGLVSTVESSAITLGEYGIGPRFSQLLKNNEIKMLDSTCPAIYAGLQAAEKGIPFIPLRGIIGSDLLENRADWKVGENPFSEDDPIVLLKAIRPDVCLFHAHSADEHGNVFVGRNRDLITLAHASARTLITVEEIIEDDFLSDNLRAGATLPAIYTSAISVAKRGAKPLAFSGEYGEDQEFLTRYSIAAKTQSGFEKIIEHWLFE